MDETQLAAARNLMAVRAALNALGDYRTGGAHSDGDVLTAAEFLRSARRELRAALPSGVVDVLDGD